MTATEPEPVERWTQSHTSTGRRVHAHSNPASVLSSTACGVRGFGVTRTPFDPHDRYACARCASIVMASS